MIEKGVCAMPENDVEAFLLSVTSSMEADMIESLLRANDIPVLRKYRESGGYMMIMMGSTIYGVDLYVPGDMLDKAREIIDSSREASKDAAFPDNVKPEETIGEAPEEEDGENWDTSEDAGEVEEDGAEKGTSGDAGKDMPEDKPGDAAKDMSGDIAEAAAGNAAAPEARDADAQDSYAGDTDDRDNDWHEEQYRLAEKHSHRKRRGRAWMSLLFFTILILILTMLVKYLYGLFAVK
jgi:hypothetical protein